jgi:hypothetical protein
MTTTLVPALGHGPLTQQGTGATPGYDAIDVRRWMSDPDLGEGVTTYGSFRVSQRAAGANLSVDINMDDFAYVRGDAVTHQALYKAAPHASTINETITTADATNPRIDRVILELKDTQHDASGSSLFQTRIVTGTPTSGATLDNLTNAGAVPNSALLLADVLVAATDTAISDSEIRDRRAFSSPATVPPLLTDVDMVVPVSPLPTLVWDVANDLVHASHDLRQSAALVYLPRRIVGATRIRWKYLHGGTAITGNYVIAIMDASGRGIVNTGSVAFTGALNTWQARSETITATTFEAGWYYVMIGLDTSAGAAGATGWGAIGSTAGVVTSSPAMPNVWLMSTTGGVTVPSTILSFVDAGPTPALLPPKVPQIALSVG